MKSQKIIKSYVRKNFFDLSFERKIFFFSITLVLLSVFAPFYHMEIDGDIVKNIYGLNSIFWFFYILLFGFFGFLLLDFVSDLFEKRLFRWKNHRFNVYLFGQIFFLLTQIGVGFSLWGVNSFAGDTKFMLSSWYYVGFFAAVIGVISTWLIIIQEKRNVVLDIFEKTDKVKKK